MSRMRAIRYADPRPSGDADAVDLAAIAARGRRLHDRAVARLLGALVAGVARVIGRAITRRGAGRVRARNTGVAIGRC